MSKSRIAIWNLERPPKLSGATREGQLEKMASVDADLWILSESARTAVLPGYHSRFSESAKGYHVDSECGAAILSRWPISGEVTTFDATFAVCVEIPHSPWGALLVYASVIPYAAWRGPNGTSSQWEEHRKSITAHAEDWKRIRDRHKNHHFIAGGDYNQCLDGSGWYGNRESEDLLRAALEGADLECVTADDFRASFGLSRGNIDHLCLSRELSGRNPSIKPWEGERLSDHNGVTVELC